MDTKVPLSITPNVLVNGELLTWYYSYGWYSGVNISGPFQNGSIINIPNVNMTKLDSQNSALNFISNMDTLPVKYLGRDLHVDLYVDKCFSNLWLLKYELSENDWHAKIHPWLNELSLVEDFYMAFSVVDKLKDLNINEIHVDRRKSYNRRDRRAIRKSKNPFLYSYANMNEQKMLLSNSLKN